MRRAATILLLGVVAACTSCASTGSPSGTKGCATAVDNYANVLLGDTGTNAQASAAGLASLQACNAVDWEVAANYDHIPLGNTDVHDVLASLCRDEDPGRSTAPCKDSIIKSLG